MSWRTRRIIGPFTGMQIVAVLAAVVVTGGLLAVLTAPISTQPQPSLPAPGSSFVPVGDPVEGLRIGDLAPEFSGTVNGQQVTLTDLDGNPISLAALRGKPVWVNFWASWCPPCQEETPILRDLYDRYSGPDSGLEIVAISVQETTAEDVRDYVDRYDLDFTVGFDATSAIFHAYRAYGLPTQLFIDHNGVIRNVVLGPVGRAQAESILAPLLEEAAAAAVR